MTRPMDAPPEDQPTKPRRRSFRDAALASGLVSAKELEDAEAVGGSRLAAAGTPAAADDRRHADAATAAVLVEQGRLTPFQSKEILAGRTRFRLGQYTVIDEVGRGGMGQVFKAEHALMGRQVAVKVLPRSKATPESEAAFRREMRILGRLDHENLVRAFDAGYDAMVYYLVTEFVPGMDLRRLVRKHGTLDAEAAASVFTQAARALAFAHGQQLVHRDVKPGNILVMDDGRVKVLDLGLAGSTLEEEAVRLGRVVGTMDYIAPEQIRTPDDVGPPADIYALGCTMYYALAGEVPFPGGTRKDKMRRHLTEAPPPIHRLATHVPPQLCQVVEAMMAKSVADRIRSADEVIARLAPWAPERPLPLPRPMALPRPSAAPAIGPHAAAAEAGRGEAVPPPWPVPEARASQPPTLSSPAPRPAPPRPPTTGGAGTDDLAPLFRESLGVMGASRFLAMAVRVVVPALLAGIGFAVALVVVRGIDRHRFEQLLGPVTPTACGMVAFLLMAAVQAAAVVGRRHR